MTWRETIPDGERETFEAYATEIRAIQKARAQGRDNFRGLHSKAHTGVAGTLAVQVLPAALQVGPFATTTTWPVYVRFSNGQPGYHSDKAPDIRGVAIKLVGVPGKKLIPGLDDALTQDFLLIQKASAGVKDPHEFLELLRAGQGSKFMLFPRLIKRVGFKRAWAILSGFLAGPKVRSMATTTFYTAVPLRFGDAACKLALVPDAADAGQYKGPEGLRTELEQRLAAGPLTWTLKVQLFVDEATTPIEDGSVRWPEDKAPWQDLAKLTLPRQDVTSEAGRAISTLVEQLSFDPWHALPELRPLGAIMRARSAAYRESTMERKAAPEPTTVLPLG